MKNALASMLVAAFTFIHFRNPATDAPLYVMDDYTDENGQPQTRRALDNDGKEMPVGVKAYGPGSKPYRRSAERIQTASIARGKKGLTGAALRENATTLMSETVFEYVNFDYNGQACCVETNRAMLDDDQYVAVRDQIEAEQADLGKFATTSSNA